MTSQPDKLFHNKLENFQRPAPAAAWDRIEAGLDKTHHKGPWMKIAAGLLLLSVAAFILWPSTVSKKTELATTKNITTPKIEGAPKNYTNATAPSVTTEPTTVQRYITPKNKVIKKDEPVLVTESIQMENEKIGHPIIESTEPSSSIQVAVIETNPKETTPSRTIVYTAEEVNSKYLRKKLPTEATPEVKKSSGIQRLMGLAYTLKNNDSGLGDLRQKKDEILALSFLNEDKTNKTKN